MDPLTRLKEKHDSIEDRLGYSFKDKTLLYTSFVHSSYVNEHKREKIAPNERLEFLGDSILGLFVADYLFKTLPEQREGVLSHLRSSLVNAPSCADYMKKLEIEEYILMGKGERLSGGAKKESVLSDAFEALLGAIYLDGGIDEAFGFLKRTIEKEIIERIKVPSRNYKADLQNYSQKNLGVHPRYEMYKELGPAHEKIFHIKVSIDGKEAGRGQGGSKKEAEISAAKNAIEKIEDADG